MARPRKDQRKDWKYLVTHHNQLWVKVTIPIDVRTAFDGKSAVLIKAGSDIGTAKKVRDRVVPRIKRQIVDARNGVTRMDPLIDQALDLAVEVPNIEDTEFPLTDFAEQIEETHGYEFAKHWYDIAAGKATAVQSVLSRFDEEHPIKPNSYHKRQKAFRTFLEFQPNATFESFDRRAAGQFVGWLIRRKGMTVQTANSYLSPLRTLWRWAEARGLAESNVWSGQSLPMRNVERQQKRAYTDDEIRYTLKNTDKLLHDAYMILLLSGMRVSELCSLRRQDMDSTNWFAVRSGKTKAAARMIWVHSSLSPIVSERFDAEYIMHEVRGNSKSLVKRMTRWRQKHGLSIRPDGQPTSEIDTHSCRRWFVNKALQAGHSEAIVEHVVGHSTKESVLLNSYHRGQWSEDQLKACVESVKLPELD